MKRQYQALLAGTGVIIFAAAIAAPVYAQGQNRFGQQSARAVTSNSAVVAPTGTLSEADTQTLQYMLEEEKLAHDIYAAMYAKWGDKLFNNIAKSELKHEAAIKTAADAYGVADTRTSQPGVFTNADLQNLYNTLLAKGLQSRTAAFEVGKTIEEVDIADLAKAQTNTAVNYLDSVYANLQKASQNHLNAFNRKLN